MSLDRVIATLHSADEELSALEIAEALWLARFLPAQATMEPPATPQHPSTPQPAADPVVGPPSAQPATDRSLIEQAPAPAADQAAALYVEAEEQTDAAGLHTRAPAVPALPRSLELARSLRPLRRRVRSTVELVLDEDETAEASAAAGRLLPRYRPSERRWLDLALVVDDSPSMVVWRRTAAEIRTLLERLGAFRHVRTWSIDAGPDGTSNPVLRAGLGHRVHLADRPARDRRELLTATGRQMILVVSDGVGPAWHSGELLAWLDQWARSAPTAVIQTLPLRLWERCALDIARLQMQGSRPGEPNSRLRLDLRYPQSRPRGVAVPVMEAEPRWMAPWASLVSSASPPPIWGMALFTGWAPRQRAFAPSPSRDEDAAQAVKRFRAGVSPEAFELARYLSAAPLNLPVMRLVQSVMLPDSLPRHLAELFLSDLLERRTPYDARQDAEAVLYDFRPGTREILAASLAPDLGLRILSRVSEFISRRFGAALDFPAVLAGAPIPSTLDEASQPFAEVARAMLYSLGGPYSRLADQLSESLSVRPARIHTKRAVVEVRGPSRASKTHVVSPSQISTGGMMTIPTLPPDSVPPSQPTVWGGVPPRNPNFTGRTELLAQLREQLTSKVAALLPHTLHGLGGVGKTQLAVEYTYQYAGDYDLIWWIPSEQPSLIRQALMALAPKLKIVVGAGDDFALTLAAINDKLRDRDPYRRWLLVFDNANRPEDLAPLLANPGGHIIITSRNRSWASVAQTIEVDVFDRSESIELLRRRLHDISKVEANRLAERLGDLPLALEQAAAWMAATATPMNDYLTLLDQQIVALMSEEHPIDYPVPVVGAWGLAFNQLAERAPSALQMLELCAFLGSEPISVRLLREGRHIAGRLPQPLGTTISEEISLRRAIRDIDRYGLAKIDSVRNSVQVHRLVQAVLRDRMAPDQRAAYLTGVHALLAAANPGEPDDEQNWPRHAELSPHIVPGRLVEGQTPEVHQVVLDQIRYRWILGDFEGSRELGALAIDRWQENLGEDNAYTLQAGRLLAIALRSLGYIGDARQLNEDLYERAQRALGLNHEYTLAIGNSRGADLRLFGQWQEALQLDQQLLERHREIFRDDDPNTTIRAANNLAVDYRLLGRFEVAREIDEDIERKLSDILGREHPDTLRLVSNLSRDHYGLGNYQRALELQRQSLPVHERVLGPDHAEVLRATRIHVVTLRKAGFEREAFEKAMVLAETSRRRLGANHPDTICVRSTLSNCLAAIGRLAEAKIVGEDAVAGFRDRLGPEHPFTLAATTNLGTVLRMLSEHEAAHTRNELALNGFHRVVGEEHHYTHCAAVNLANDLHALGRYAEALELSRVTRDGMTRVYGNRHPQVLVCIHNYTIDLEQNGRAEEAARFRGELSRRIREVFGVGHPEAIQMEEGKRGSIEIEPPSW